jgi:hypothetical protein
MTQMLYEPVDIGMWIGGRKMCSLQGDEYKTIILYLSFIRRLFNDCVLIAEDL